MWNRGGCATGSTRVSVCGCGADASALARVCILAAPRATLKRATVEHATEDYTTTGLARAWMLPSPHSPPPSLTGTTWSACQQLPSRGSVSSDAARRGRAASVGANLSSSWSLCGGGILYWGCVHGEARQCLSSSWSLWGGACNLHWPVCGEARLRRECLEPLVRGARERRASCSSRRAR